MFTVGVPRPTFYLLHSLYYTKHFCVMHIQTLNITVPHACYRLLLVQHYSFIHCKDVEQEASHCILRERLCVLAVPVWVLPAYLQRAQPYVNYKAVHHTRLSYTKEPLISKHGTWITSIFPSNLFTALRGFSHMCKMGNHRSELKWWYYAFFQLYSSINADNICKFFSPITCTFGFCRNLCQTITT